MIDVRGSVYDLLKTLPVGVYHSRVDQFKSDKYPVINVQIERTDKKMIAAGVTFRTTCDLLVVIAVATTAPDFDSQLDVLVDQVTNKILTNAEWVKTYESTPEIRTDYGYAQAGEQDLAVAKMRWSVTYSETYDPNLPNIFDTADIKVEHAPNEVELLVTHIY